VPRVRHIGVTEVGDRAAHLPRLPLTWLTIVE
jgi:hypothetical protein